MAIVYATALKTARLEAVVDAIDGGTGAGTVEIGTTGMGTVLAVLTLDEPCGTVTDDVLTFDFDPDLSTLALDTGEAAAARIKDGDGNVIVSGLTVGLSDADIVLDSVNITVNQTVVLETGEITHG